MLSNARPKYNVNKVPRWVFCYVGNKLLISPVEKGIFCPKTAKFGPKLAFLVNLGQGMHLVPCWCVGWWLWRACCISQDTYLLYNNYLKEKYSHSEKAKTYKGTVEEVEIISVSLESKSDFTINRCLRGEVFDSLHKGVSLARGRHPIATFETALPRQ